MDSCQSSKFVPIKFLREATWRNERISRAESDRTIYFENDHNGVGFESRSLTLREERVVLPIRSFLTSAM